MEEQFIKVEIARLEHYSEQLLSEMKKRDPRDFDAWMRISEEFIRVVKKIYTLKDTLEVENVNLEDRHYLKNKEVYSEISSHAIRSLFENKMKHINVFDLEVDAHTLGYKNSFTQYQWKQFYDGFRIGEDCGNDSNLLTHNSYLTESE